MYFPSPYTKVVANLKCSVLCCPSVDIAGNNSSKFHLLAGSVKLCLAETSPVNWWLRLKGRWRLMPNMGESETVADSAGLGFLGEKCGTYATHQ